MYAKIQTPHYKCCWAFHINYEWAFNIISFGINGFHSSCKSSNMSTGICSQSDMWQWSQFLMLNDDCSPVYSTGVQWGSNLSFCASSSSVHSKKHSAKLKLKVLINLWASLCAQRGHCHVVRQKKQQPHHKFGNAL